MTNGEFVSRVINGLRAINIDDHISRRYILNIGQNKSKFYIAQKLTEKTLFRETNLFRTIECFKLDEEETLKCGVHEFMRCDSLMKSRKKIPGLVFNRLGSSVVSITSLNGDIEFQPTTPKSYKNSKDRRYVQKLGVKHFYIKDGFLYLPDSTVEYVTITYIPFDETEVEEVSQCGNETNEGCKSVWDYEFIVPDKLSEQVVTETIQEVFNSKRVPVDTLPNLDENQKTYGGT